MELSFSCALKSSYLEPEETRSDYKFLVVSVLKNLRTAFHLNMFILAPEIVLSFC